VAMPLAAISAAESVTEAARAAGSADKMIGSANATPRRTDFRDVVRGFTHRV